MGAPADRIEAHVVVDTSGAMPADVLQDATGLKKQRIKLAMTRGAVWITRGRNTRRLRRAKRALRAGDELHIYYDAAILAEMPPEPALIADKGAYSVWQKPCGLRSQGSKWGDHCTVVRYAERHLQPERTAFTVHRLDRAASGLLLVAHAKGTAAALSALFRKRKVEKRYLAVVTGELSGQPGPLRIEQAIEGKEALSEVCVLEVMAGGSQTLVEIRTGTGRKHQVRRHLAAIGHPIVGDRLYGSGAGDGKDLQLTAYLLAFRCPIDGKRVEYRLR